MRLYRLTKPFTLFLCAFILTFISHNISFAQTVSCPTCTVGICDGESLSGYVNISGYPTPITITNITGAVSGAGSSLSNYSFSTGGSSITINFTDGDADPHTKTLPVTVNTISANFSYTQGSCLTANFNSNGSSSSGTINSRTWKITKNVNGITIPITNLGGATTSYNFESAGTYNVCLKVKDNNGCEDEYCENITVSGVEAGLTFYKNGNISINPAEYNPYLIPYCNLSPSSSFSIFFSNNSNIIGGGTISNYKILLDGVIIYNDAIAPQDITLTTQDPGFSGYLETKLIVTHTNGCESTVIYQVYLGRSIQPQFTAQISTIDYNCPGEEIEIQTNITQDNPEGVDYELLIVCDPDDLSAPLASWSWNQSTPDLHVYWTPPYSSCECVQNAFHLVTTAAHPCEPAPDPAFANFKVALPSDAAFIKNPSGNLCLNDLGEYVWDFSDNLVPGKPWCMADIMWSITDENNNNIPINGSITDGVMSHIFTDPGTYEVCLNLSSFCGDPTHCETVCVNPPISEVTLSPIWNIPDTLCPGDYFTSTLSYNDLAYCSTPEVNWKLRYQGAVIETYTGLSANVQNLQQGAYELEAIYKLENCGQLSITEPFEVFAPPVISPQITGPLSAVCAGDDICFDSWFCIDDNGIPITDFEIRLYEGFLINCPENPTANLVETIANTPPFPPYSDCDPNPNICSYNWTAASGKYTLWIKATNHCGSDYECITIDIPFPETPEITGNSEVCLDEVVVLGASLAGGSFQFTSCPSGNCPTQGSAPGQYTVSGSSLSWNTANGTNPYGDYTVSYGGDCIGTGNFVITLNPLPEFLIVSDLGNTVCADDLVTLNIDYQGINPLDHCTWTNSQTGATLSNSSCEISVNPSPGNNQYQVTVWDENGCTSSQSIQIAELIQPFDLNCSSIQSAYCNNAGATIQLNTLLSPNPTNGILKWQLNGTTITGNTLQLDGLPEGTQVLSYTWDHPLSPNCEFTGSCSFEITPPSVPNLTTSPEYCSGDVVSIVATVPGNLAGNWQFIDCPGTCPSGYTATDFLLNWNTTTSTPAGIYTVSYSGVCLDYQEITFVINPIPDFTLTSSAALGYCEGEEIMLEIDYSGSESITCTWTNDNTNTQIPPVGCTITDNPVDQTTDYTVVVTDGNSCSNSESISIQVQDQPFVFDCSSIAPSYCENQAAVINLADLVSINPANPGFNWYINGTSITGNHINIAELDPGEHVISYVFTHSSAPFCTFEGACSFTVSPLTVPAISGNDPVCAGEEINLTIVGTGGFSGVWTFTEVPGALPTDFISDVSSLNWSTSGTTESGIYTVTYSGECLSTVSYSFEIYALPDFTITSSSSGGLCDGGESIMEVDYSGALSIICEWTNDNTDTQIPDTDCSVTVNPIDQTTDYTVIVTDSNSCFASESVDIQIQEQPFTFDCSGIENVYCDNEVAFIYLSDLVSISPADPGFIWNLNGEILTGNNIDVEALDPNDYTLAYSYTHIEAPFCTFQDSCTFTISGLTTPTISGNGPICAGDELTVNVSGTGSFIGTWEFTAAPGTPPSNFTSTDFSLAWLTTAQTESGTYIAQYSGNCLETVSYTFEIFAIPEFTILSIPDAVFCSGDSVHITVNYLGNAEIEGCQWTNALNEVIPTQECQIGVAPQSDSETYSVMVTDTNSCSTIDSIELNIQPQPFGFDCSSIDNSYCDNEEVTINFSDLVSIPTGSDFEWFLNNTLLPGNSLELKPLSPSETPYFLSYIYTHPDAPHCTFQDSCSFTITQLTMPSVIGNNAICTNETINLISDNTAGFTGSFTFTDCPSNDCPTNFTSDSDQLTWETNAEVNPSGTYEIQYTGTCLDTAIFTIEIFPLPPFSVITLPGEIVCAEDEISIEFNYEGTSQIDSCALFDNSGNSLTPSGACEWTLLPESLGGTYIAILGDDNACVNEKTFNIDVQTQPFTFSCSPVNTTYCDNSIDVITLTDLVSPIPTNGTLVWYLNGAIISTPTLDIYNLIPGNYSIAYTYTHGDAPHCEFTNACSFTVTELIQPNLNSSLAFCQGENIQITASGLEGFEGIWTSISCPEPPCNLQGTNPAIFQASSTNLALGTYTLQYAGLCLETTTIDFEILGNPTVQWTPEDITPCLNECFTFEEEVLEHYSNFGWEYFTFSDQGTLSGNEVCFPEINNPESVDICLWADLNHPVQDTVFTCRVQDCHQINPVFSPGNFPEVPEVVCPGEILEIDVDYSLYDDCTFVLNNNYIYENCSSINIPTNEYGSIPYDFILFYNGCSDTLSGNVFIPEPPSAALEVSYDICIGDALIDWTNLRGDMLTFSWSVVDALGNNYNFLMDDNNSELPVPNPIPISNLDLNTDTTFYVTAIVGNVCTSITLKDTVHYISKPSIDIDIDNVAGTQFCLPHNFYFEIGEFATNYIDSVQWTFQSIYDYGNIEAIAYPNLQFPPPLIFTNNGVADTVVVTATAWNICGSDTDSINFTLIPPDLYLEMPDYADGLCPGESITIPVLILEGDPFDGCEVTSDPLIPGLQFACQGNLNSVLVTIPASTPSGTYTLKTTVFGCGISKDFTEIEVFAVPEINFSMANTACTNTPVNFENQVAGATSFYWDFGDPASGDNNHSELPFPIHTYALPGIYNVKLIAYNSAGCSSELIKSIEIFGPNPLFSLNNKVICSGDSILSEVGNQEDILSLEWEYLLPGIDTLIYTVQNAVSNIFINKTDSLQFWTVTLTLQDIHGCVATDNARIVVLPQPLALFTYGDLDGCPQGIEVQMINQSTPGTSNFWNFNDPGSRNNNVSSKRNPTHSFTRAGDYLISLHVQNTYGCTSEFTKLLSCSKLLVYVPNAFTPDRNRINEIFKPVIHGIHDIDFTVSNYYTFEVYDRWGQLVFLTHDPDKGWDGSSPDKDYYSEQDVYIWQVRIEFPTGAEKWQGHVTLVR